MPSTMAGALPPEDGTTGLADDFSHFSLDHFSLDHFSSHNANPGASYLSPQVAGASNAGTYFLEPSDLYGSTTPQPPPPFDPKNPFVCDFQHPDGKMCYVKKPRQCDLTKHQKNHTKPTVCGLCDASVAEAKDLGRHYITHHPDSREGQDAKKKSKQKKNAVCPTCKFDGNGRSDNVKRHREAKGH
ncbi:hypothetical protein B0T18DRAFT_237070 [Schizothecium vesticola]|uniref:C2H2-type domain-containing protein n=1 Tax=Schizothecium vesticola TaxID=314040 RepID=A0AA40BPD5_9PEZI|nr:hypothetical protein B0T18DRAFT_237070 [Schizothecium vesticola]